MALLITDPKLESELIAERERCDGDRFDEVWEGIYVMAPLPNDEHQDIQANFVAAFKVPVRIWFSEECRQRGRSNRDGPPPPRKVEGSVRRPRPR